MMDFENNIMIKQINKKKKKKDIPNLILWVRIDLLLKQKWVYLVHRNSVTWRLTK